MASSRLGQALRYMLICIPERYHFSLRSTDELKQRMNSVIDMLSRSGDTVLAMCYDIKDMFAKLPHEVIIIAATWLMGIHRSRGLVAVKVSIRGKACRMARSMTKEDGFLSLSFETLKTMLTSGFPSSYERAIEIGKRFEECYPDSLKLIRKDEGRNVWDFLGCGVFLEPSPPKVHIFPRTKNQSYIIKEGMLHLQSMQDYKSYTAKKVKRAILTASMLRLWRMSTDEDAAWVAIICLGIEARLREYPPEVFFGPLARFAKVEGNKAHRFYIIMVGTIVLRKNLKRPSDQKSGKILSLRTAVLAMSWSAARRAEAIGRPQSGVSSGGTHVDTSAYPSCPETPTSRLRNYSVDGRGGDSGKLTTASQSHLSLKSTQSSRQTDYSEDEVSTPPSSVMMVDSGATTQRSELALKSVSEILATPAVSLKSRLFTHSGRVTWDKTLVKREGDETSGPIRPSSRIGWFAKFAGDGMGEGMDGLLDFSGLAKQSRRWKFDGLPRILVGNIPEPDPTIERRASQSEPATPQSDRHPREEKDTDSEMSPSPKGSTIAKDGPSAQLAIGATPSGGNTIPSSDYNEPLKDNANDKNVPMAAVTAPKESVEGNKAPARPGIPRIAALASILHQGTQSDRDLRLPLASGAILSNEQNVNDVNPPEPTSGKTSRLAPKAQDSAAKTPRGDGILRGVISGTDNGVQGVSQGDADTKRVQIQEDGNIETDQNDMVMQEPIPEPVHLDEAEQLYGPVIAKFQAGDVFGERELIRKRARNSTCIAMDDTQLMYLEAHDFYTLMNVILPQLEQLQKIITVLKRRSTSRTDEDIDFLLKYVSSNKFFQGLDPTTQKEVCRVALHQSKSRGDVRARLSLRFRV
ncbi:hypothetical protein CBR_g37814 [Chara braunii]|uniref:Cyclic nucleotide-binding domain-containing protein n=1 Tax=Chara braunii TaxID=69332 RepID=A0A388LP03_CHABU|nr:hypothetical protein CBR_g37814 [Chara braunii]|eukprot:GBG83942.1 hypothetical protein CBR_g37814 [Chara braunii]